MTFGGSWNYDYISRDAKKESSYIDINGRVQPDMSQHPPCMCGECLLAACLTPLAYASCTSQRWRDTGADGLETKDFVKAAELKDFSTFYQRCRAALTSKDFQWPEGVTSVDFGFGDPIKKPWNFRSLVLHLMTDMQSRTTIESHLPRGLSSVWSCRDERKCAGWEYHREHPLLGPWTQRKERSAIPNVANIVYSSLRYHNSTLDDCILDRINAMARSGDRKNDSFATSLDRKSK